MCYGAVRRLFFLRGDRFFQGPGKRRRCDVKFPSMAASKVLSGLTSRGRSSARETGAVKGL